MLFQSQNNKPYSEKGIIPPQRKKPCNSHVEQSWVGIIYNIEISVYAKEYRHYLKSETERKDNMLHEFCLLEPLFIETVQLYEKELEKRGYRPSAIEGLLFQIKRIYRSPLGGKQGYSISKSQKWL